MIPKDIAHTYPKTGLSADIRMDRTPTFISAGSLHLPGGGTDDVQVNGLSWTSDGAWSFSCWVKSNDLTTGSNKKFFSVHASGNSHRIDFQAVNDSDLQLFKVNSSTSPFHNFAGAAARIQDGTWHHVALVATASGSDNVYKLYLDGQQHGSDSSALARSDISSADSGHIGNMYTGSAASLAGNLAHVAFWNAALSEDQVRSLMTATTYAEAVTKGGSTPAAYYLFELDANTSVGSPNGTLGGSAFISPDRCRLPNGLDLTRNRFDARLVSGRGIDLDGAGDFISMGHPDDLDGFFNTGGTISMWINMTSTANFDRVFDFSTGTFVYLHGAFNGYNFNKDFTTTDGVWVWNGNGGVALGEWFHFCLSYDASSTSNNPDLYINGVLQTIDSEITPEGSANADTTEKRIGSDAGGTGNLDASLAHIKFITSTVTAAQALELYKNPEQILPTGIATSALKAWLPCSDFDITPSDNSLDGMFAQDASGNGNHGALTNCGMVLAQPAPCPQLGLQSSSSRMLIQDDELVTISSSTSLNVFSGADGGGSVAFWIFVNSAGESSHGRVLFKNSKYELITRNESGGTCELQFEVPGFSGGTAVHRSAKSIAVGAWTHVVMTYTGLYNANPIFYINGSPTTNAADTQTTGTFTDSGDLVLGNKADGSRSIDAILSEVGLWSSILDADAVAVLYNSGVQGFDPTENSGNYDVSSDLTALYRLDNPVTIEDLSTNSNPGTVSGSPNMVTIPEGPTADRSVCGTLTQRYNQHVFSGMPLTPGAVANGGALQFKPFQFGTDNFTIHFWYRISHAHWGGAANARLLHSAGSTGYINLLAYQTNAYWCVIQGASGLINLNNLQPGTHNVAGDWVQICIRREAAALFTFHSRTLGGTVGLDNDDNSTVDIGAINLDSPFGLRLGAGHNDTNPYNNASGASFCGVRIYKGTAISDAQVNQLFEADARILRSL